MKLPKIDKPIFELLVPSQKKTVMCRPYVCKEEKILLIAQESGEEKDIVLALKQVLNNCIVDENFDIDSITTFDLEYMFLKLRAKSVNNIVAIKYRDQEDAEVYEFQVDLDQVEMLDLGKLKDTIMINETTGMQMKYPSITLINDTPTSASQAELIDYLVKACIKSIFDEENVYPVEEVSEKELQEFLDDLPVSVLNDLTDFFKNLPRMYYKLEYKDKEGKEKHIELRNLRDFFILG
jgi:hypothetical protein